MRTRIAQKAARDLVASVRTTSKRSTRLFRRAAGCGLVSAALVSGAMISPSTAAAHHRFDTKHRKGEASIALPPRLSLMPMATHWLTAWREVDVRVHTAARGLARFRAEKHAQMRLQSPRRQSPPRSSPSSPSSPSSLPTDSNSTTTPDWACIRLHESGDQYNSPTAPGGAYGFLEITWLSLGYSGWPYQASAGVQSRAALFLYNEFGWQPWSTRFVCGL